MATQRPRSRSNVAKSSQLTKFKFHWWMALVLVGVVAVIGVVIVRFSHASSVTNIYAVKTIGDNSTRGCPFYNGTAGAVDMGAAGVWCLRGTFQSGLTRVRRQNDGQCAYMQMGTSQSKGQYLKNGAMPVNTWITVYETTSCDV